MVLLQLATNIVVVAVAAAAAAEVAAGTNTSDHTGPDPSNHPLLIHRHPRNDRIDLGSHAGRFAEGSDIALLPSDRGEGCTSARYGWKITSWPLSF